LTTFGRNIQNIYRIEFACFGIRVGWPYTAGLLVGWATVCGRVNHLGM